MLPDHTHSLSIYGRQGFTDVIARMVGSRGRQGFTDVIPRMVGS